MMLMTEQIKKLSALIMSDLDKEINSFDDRAKNKMCSILYDAITDPYLKVIEFEESKVDYEHFEPSFFKFKNSKIFVNKEDDKMLYFAIRGKQKAILVFNVALTKDGYRILPYMCILKHVYTKFNVEVLKIHNDKKRHNKVAQNLLEKSVATILSVICHSNTTKH